MPTSIALTYRNICATNDKFRKERTQLDVARDTRRSANADCTALCAWNVECSSFLLGVGVFRPKFYGNGGHFRQKCFIPFDR